MYFNSNRASKLSVGRSSGRGRRPSTPPSGSGRRVRWPVGAVRSSLIRIACESGADILEECRAFISAYAENRFHTELAQRIAVVSYELMANAIHYGSVSGEVVYELWVTDDLVEIEVSNEAIAARLDQLEHQIDKLRAAPEEAYTEALRSVVTGRGTGPAFGLSRVCHEGRMELDMVIENGRATVTARGRR